MRTSLIAKIISGTEYQLLKDGGNQWISPWPGLFLALLAVL